MPALAVLALLVAAVPPPPMETEANPFSLTLYGAASLGAYEAGVDWTVLQLIRVDRTTTGPKRNWPLSLEGLSGSSAGAINALLAAALWCEMDGATENASVDRNVLRDTWMPLGFDELLPVDPSGYITSDGLFASAAFASVIQAVRDRIFAPGGMRFRPGCRVPFGFTVTRVVPDIRVVSGVQVREQRELVSVVLEVDPQGAPHLRRQKIAPAAGAKSALLTLPERPDASGWSFPPEEIIQGILAASAFPVAFGARPLCECRARCGSGQREVQASECPGPMPGQPLAGLSCGGYSAERGGQELKLCRSNFIDGGFLDNVPVGLAIDQAEAFGTPRTLQPLTAYVVDPSSRRPRPEVWNAPERTAQGFTDAVTFANDLVATARERRLAEAISARNWSSTTRDLLQKSAWAVLEYGRLAAELTGKPAPPSEVPVSRRGRGRPRQARLILTCLRDLGHGTPGVAEGIRRACASALGNPVVDVATGGAGGGPPLAPAEVLALAETLGTWVTGPSMNDPEATVVASATMAFLADELGRFAHQAVEEGARRQMRAACLRTVFAVQDLVDRGVQRVRSSARSEVEVLTREPLPTVRKAATTALEDFSRSRIFRTDALASLLASLPAAGEAALSPGARASLDRLRFFDRLRPAFIELASTAQSLSQDASAIQSDVRGQRRLILATRFAPLAGEKLEHFAGFMDPPLRELDYYTGVYEALHDTAGFLCAEQDPYSELRPVAVWRGDGRWELDLTRPETQRCLGVEMGNSFRVLGLGESPKADRVVRTLARRELAAWLGDAAAAESMAASPEWGWLGPKAPDLTPLGAMGIALHVLLEPAVPCSRTTTLPLCPGDLTFEQFLERLAAAGYRGESRGMQAALTDRGRWFADTVQRALDRAGTVEILQSQDDAPTTRRAVSMGIGAGETVSRAAAHRGEVGFQLDPSTIPTRPLADGSYLPIALAHLVPYRVALDVVGGGIALSWLEPRVQLGRWFSVESTLQLVDLRFNPVQGFSTLGVRGQLHLGPVSVGAGPRWSLGWNNAGSHFGVEFDLLVLQDRLGVSFGFRDVGDEGWKTPFVALTVADLNGMLYWLVPPAWRSGR